MAELYLMERNSEKMNVPAAKKETFEADGWKVLKTPEENKHVVVTDQPVVEPVSVETTPPPAPPHQETADGEGSDASTSAQRGVSVEEAVEKIGKRSRSKKG